MASPPPPPRRLLAGSANVGGAGDKENFCQFREEMARQEGPPPSATRRKQPGAGGFNLRKSIAWNPAFFTEEGVLDNSELSMLSGSQVKAGGSSGSGLGTTVSPSCRFARSGSTSVLKEVAENARGKFRSTESKGRKLFPSAKAPEHDERKKPAGTHDKRSAKDMQKCMPPRPPAGYSQKKLPSTSATAQVSRVPKKSQPSLPMVPRSTSSVTAASKSNKKIALVKNKTEHTRRVEGLTLTSKIKPTSMTTSSKPNTEKDVVSAVTAIREEAYDSGKCSSFPPSQTSPSRSVGMPASTLAKPSALRMPSPSVGFFAQGKAHVSHADTAQRDSERSITGKASSLAKPPQKNAEKRSTANTSTLVKPPRCKQPGDLKSKLCASKQLPTNCSAALDLPVQSLTSESTLNTLASSAPCIEHANVCSTKESLSRGIEAHSSNSGDTDNQEMPGASCLLAESGLPIQSFSSEKNDGARNGLPNAYNDELHAQAIDPTEDSHSLKANCSSTIEPVENSCSLKSICPSTKLIMGRTLSSSCIPSQMCTFNDFDYQGKPENCSSATIGLENSLGETAAAVSLSEGNNYTPIPDSLQDFDSCYQQNTECSTLKKSMESATCVDKVIRCSSSGDTKTTLANSKFDMDYSLCKEAQPTSSEGPSIDGGKEPNTGSSFIVKETQLLHVVREFDHNYRSSECSPMQLATPMPCVDQEARTTDLKAVTFDKTELYNSLTKEQESILLEETNTEDDNMELDTNELSEDASPSRIDQNKAVDKARANTIHKDSLKHLVPFTEEWLAVMEACGEEVLEQKSGAVQNSPTEKVAPEPSPWSPVKRKAQDVGPFDCTKYSKSVRTSSSP